MSLHQFQQLLVEPSPPTEKEKVRRSITCRLYSFLFLTVFNARFSGLPSGLVLRLYSGRS